MTSRTKSPLLPKGGTRRFLSSLSIPEACLLDKPVYKKMFLDHAELDQTDKKALSEDVGRIRWQYTLKPDTINIAPFQDSEREYLEIAILSVELSSPARLNRIAAFTGGGQCRYVTTAVTR
jgi:hypothetical protein